MNIDALVSSMSQQTYERLLQAVETGKWLDGSPLTENQRESSMQAVMMYQAKVLKLDEHMMLNADGEINHKSRQQFKNEFAQQGSIARFKQDDF
ncbi:YeaC family protein [Aliiglaciecola litoralis]|uniref:YeaC family protein n=1 Tax=Aliiglaciecola litoralis TaxID=582857 RepID=A0ABP3WW17_9ALTE